MKKVMIATTFCEHCGIDHTVKFETMFEIADFLPSEIEISYSPKECDYCGFEDFKFLNLEFEEKSHE